MNFLLPPGNRLQPGAFFLLLLLLTAGLLRAQDHILDSLEKRLNALPPATAGHPDTNSARLMNAISFRSKTIGQYENAHRYSDAVIKAYSRKDIILTKADSSLLGDAYSNKGVTYYRQGKYDSALLMHNHAIHIWTTIHDLQGYSMTLSQVALIYDDQGNYPRALEYNFQAVRIREKLNDQKAMASIYGNIGENYRSMKDTAKALEYYRKSLDISSKLAVTDPKNIDNKRVMSNALNNLGIIYDDKGDKDLSISYHLRALAIRTEIGDKSSIAGSLNNIGLEYRDKGDYKTSLDYLNRAFDLKKLIGSKKGMCAGFLNIAGVYLRQKNFTGAHVYLDSALFYSGQLGIPELETEIYMAYSDYYAAVGQPGKALEWYKLFIHVRDSLQSEESTRQSVRAELNYAFEKKAAKDSTHLAEQKKLDDLENEGKVKRQRMYTYGGIAGSVLMLVVALVSFRAYRQKQAANHLISVQKSIVEEKQREILDSINYARRIQYALLAQGELLQENLRDHFILFRPKDIVSGDFYWAATLGNRLYLAVCDSTGHGVPGAFMSLLNISYLNEALIEKNILQPDKILNHVRKRLIESVSQDDSSMSMQDGMDCILICYDKMYNTVSYAAAYNAPVLIRDNELQTLSSDKMPVGKGEKSDPFTLHTIHLREGDSIYLYTDGYADQFGGVKGKKYKYKKLNEFLVSVHMESCPVQKEKLEAEFDEWKGNLEQVDDICIIGIRV